MFGGGFLFAIGAFFSQFAASLPQDPQLAAPGTNIDQYAVGALPKINFPVPKSWAGELAIGPGYGNDTLFFWLWQAESATANGQLIIWFNGGPACSSMVGIFKEHGPILFENASQNPTANPYSWTKFANLLVVDQPADTGFSQGNTPPTDNASLTAGYVQWLGNFLNKFPALKGKKIHLLGESYAGIYIPYMAEAIYNHSPSLGITISSIGLGDATWADNIGQTSLVATTYIEQNQKYKMIAMPKDVHAVLDQADKDCGYTSALTKFTYPARGKIQIPIHSPSTTTGANPPPGYDPSICDFTGGTKTAAQVQFLINGTACYGICATQDAAENYFYGFPERCFFVYDINIDCSAALYSDDAWQDYLNIAAVQKALHVSPSVTFTECNGDLFNVLGSQANIEPPANSIIPNLLKRGTKVHIWAGALDYQLNHIGIEVSIQNMTWSGAQGFAHAPNTKWNDINGNYAGTWGVERGLGYYLFAGAGHRVSQDQPAAAFTMVKQRIVNNAALPSKC